VGVAAPGWVKKQESAGPRRRHDTADLSNRFARWFSGVSRTAANRRELRVRSLHFPRSVYSNRLPTVSYKHITTTTTT